MRLPLPQLTVVTSDPEGLRPFAGIVADELNVKAVTVLDVAEAHESDFGISQRLVVNARAAGPRLGRDVQTAIKGSKTGDWSVADDGTVTSGGLALVEGEYVVETVVDAEQAGSHIDRDAARWRVRRARHRRQPRARGRGCGPRPGARGAAGPARRRVRRVRPHLARGHRRRVRLPRRARPPRARDAARPSPPSCRSRPTSTTLDRDGEGVTEVVIGERYPARLRVTRR